MKKDESGKPPYPKSQPIEIESKINFKENLKEQNHSKSFVEKIKEEQNQIKKNRFINQSF